ncbi:hypothetical protein Tco_1445025, partial [Tanacetum coccineum]
MHVATNAKASGSASRQAQQTEPAVGQDGSGRSGAGAVIGLSVAAAGHGGVGGPGGASVGSQGSIPINRGLIQAIPRSLPPQPIGEATKASNLQRIPPGFQGRSHFTYFLYLIIEIRIL